MESRWSYNTYRKSVFAISFLESLRLAATCDGTIQVINTDLINDDYNFSDDRQVLDPFRGQLVYRYAQPKDTLSFAAMTSMPAPSTNILAATSDGIVR